MRHWMLLSVVFFLASCSRAGSQNDADQARVAAPPSTDSSEAAASSAAPAAASTVRSAAAPALAQAAPMLAYSYDYGVEAPPSKIRPLMAADQGACASASAAVCQVTGADVSTDGPDQVTAKLTIRATPAWLNGYEDRLSREAQQAGGQLVHASVSSEDLTRNIVDTDAAVKAKTTLRDRLQALLASRPGKVGDLVSLEQALASAQADLDSTTSELAVMRERVATSDVTIDYDSAGVLAPQGVWSPVGRAVASALSVIAASVAAMIYLVAIVLPWALVLALVIWLFRKRLPRVGRRPPPTPPASDAPKPG